MSDLFNEKAKTWDADNAAINLSSAIGATMLEHVPFHGQMDVMDFGAGTGLISSHVAPKVNKIVAVDISRAMLDKLVAKAEFNGKVEAVCQNIVEKPLNAKFDLIISAMALHHVKNTNKLAQTFFQHLKPQGTVALADLDREDGSFHPENAEGVFHFGFARDKFQAILENAGFANVQYFTAYTIHKNDKNYPVFLVVATKNRNDSVFID